MAVDQVIAAFEEVLNSADAVHLLLQAEAGGSATAACASIATNLGYPPANHIHNYGVFCSFIGTRLAALRYLTAGPTLDCPRGNFYTYVF